KFCPQGAAAPSASSGRSSEGAAGAALRFSQAPTVARRETRLSAREPGGRNFCRATARRNGFPLKRGAGDTLRGCYLAAFFFCAFGKGNGGFWRRKRALKGRAVGQGETVVPCGQAAGTRRKGGSEWHRKETAACATCSGPPTF